MQLGLQLLRGNQHGFMSTQVWVVSVFICSSLVSHMHRALEKPASHCHREKKWEQLS